MGVALRARNLSKIFGCVHRTVHWGRESLYEREINQKLNIWCTGRCTFGGSRSASEKSFKIFSKSNRIGALRAEIIQN